MKKKCVMYISTFLFLSLITINIICIIYTYNSYSKLKDTCDVPSKLLFFTISPLVLSSLTTLFSLLIVTIKFPNKNTLYSLSFISVISFISGLLLNVSITFTEYWKNVTSEYITEKLKSIKIIAPILTSVSLFCCVGFAFSAIIYDDNEKTYYSKLDYSF